MFNFSGPAAFMKTARIVYFYCSKKYKIKKYAPLRIPDISFESLVLNLEFPDIAQLAKNDFRKQRKMAFRSSENRKRFFYGIFSTHTMIVVHFWTFLRPLLIGDLFLSWINQTNIDKCLFSRRCL